MATIATKSVRVVLEALVSQYQAKMAAATASTTAFGNSALKSAHQHQQAFNTLGVAALGIGAGIGFAMKSAADAAIDFESSFAGVRKTVDASEAEFSVLEDQLRGLAKQIPVNVNDLNRIAEAAGQLGVEKDAIVGFTEVVAKLGATTNLAGDEAATSLARIANIMQTPQDEFDRLASTIVALGNAGASTESEITEMSLRIAGAGKIVGLSEADVLAFANALSSVGIEAQAGGSAISKAFIEVANAVSTGNDKLDVFAEVAGMSTTEFAEAFRTDAAGAMVAFIEGLGRMNDAGQNVFGVLDQLGLSEVRVRTAMLSAAGAGDLFRESIELGSQAWEDNNALNEEAAKRFATTASQVQLARNRINDAAISFGQLMLPAIAAVVGSVGDFADLIGGLPGPVKAAALVIGLVATGMALVSGATLVLLPRLAAAKVAMAQMGVQGGMFRGSLALAAKAINPVTIALTAVTLAVGAYANSKAEATRRTDEFASAVEADTGALGANTQALLLNELTSSGVLKRLDEMGVKYADVQEKVFAFANGNEQAGIELAGLAQQMGGSEMIDFGLIVEGLTSGMDEAALKAKAMGGATDDAGDAAEGAVGPMTDLGDATEDAATMAEQLKDALDGLAGTELDVEKSSLAWLDAVSGISKELTHQTNAQGKLTDKLLPGVKALDDSTEAGRALREQILQSIDAAIEHGAAIADETGSLKQGAKAVANHIEELKEQAVKAGVSKEAIDDYIASLDLTPAQVKTTIRLLGATTVKGQITDIVQQLHQLPASATIQIGLEGGPPGGVGHAGGTIGALHARRLHAGGRIRGDEELFIGQRGERVLSAREWRALRSITGAGAGRTVRRADRGRERTIRVMVRADRRKFNDELDHDSTFSGRW